MRKKLLLNQTITRTVGGRGEVGGDLLNEEEAVAHTITRAEPHSHSKTRSLSTQLLNGLHCSLEHVTEYSNH